MIQLIESYGDSHLGRRNPAYDGRKSLYTAGPLPFKSKEFAVKLIDNDGRGASSKSPRYFLLVYPAMYVVLSLSYVCDFYHFNFHFI